MTPGTSYDVRVRAGNSEEWGGRPDPGTEAAGSAAQPVATVLTSALPDISKERVFHEFFDIASGSGAGSEVVGRINLERNRNVGDASIPKNYEFTIVEDDSGGMFNLRTERDSDGRLFGVFSVGDGKTAQAGHYSLRVELRKGS